MTDNQFCDIGDETRPDCIGKGALNTRYHEMAVAFALK